MDEIKEKTIFGLEKLTLDTRDYSHDLEYGTLGTYKIPTNDFTIYDSFTYTIVWGDTLSAISKKFCFTLSQILAFNPKITNPNKISVGQTIIIPAVKPIILNQLDLDFCVGFATTTLQNITWQIKNDPLYQFAKIKQIRGEYKAYGANLRDGMKAATKFGSLPLVYAPYTHNGSPTDKNRDFLANWVNWPIDLDKQAFKEKDLSYFIVDGTYDIFDNIRSTLALHLQERRAVTFGLYWHDEWTEAPGGIIPPIMPTTSYGGGHDISIVGQKTINGVLYLVLQQSWGDTAGDRGFYYFPRSIIDQSYALGYGAYTLSNKDSSGLGGSSGVLTALATFINKILGKI